MPRPQVIHCASPGFKIPTFPAVSGTFGEKERSKKNGTSSSSQSENLQTKQQRCYICCSECYNIASTAVVFIEKMVQLFGPKKSSWLRSPGESGSKYVNVTKPRCAWSGNPSGNATVKSCGATGRLNSFSNEAFKTLRPQHMLSFTHLTPTQDPHQKPPGRRLRQKDPGALN